jgi:hypothetical protein
MEAGGRYRELVRTVGGLTLATGAVILLAHKSGAGGWSGGARLLIVLIPTLLLYAVSIRGETPGGDRPPSPSRSVLLVLAILLTATSLLFLVSLLKVSGSQALWNAAIFAFTGVIGAAAAITTRVRYGILLASLSLLIAWAFLWDEILSSPSIGTYRWLLLAGGALLLLAAFVAMRRKAFFARELATAGGLGAVLSGAIGVFVSTVAAAAAPFLALGAAVSFRSEQSHGSGFSRAPLHGKPPPLAHHPHHALQALERSHRVVHELGGLASGMQDFGWNLYLLIISIALVWIGARAKARGPAYAGGFGLLAFVYCIGISLTSIAEGRGPSHALVGWPLALLIVGALCLLAPTLPARRR